MKNNERTKLENAILDELNLSDGEWKYWDTGGGFSALVWEGVDSYIVVTDNEDECMAPTTWNHELMVGHYVGGEYDTIGDLDKCRWQCACRGKDAFFALVRPIIETEVFYLQMEQDCSGHRDTGRGVCSECGTFL